jgi:hypothetical protein
MLVALAVGFSGYAAWRFLRAATGASEGKGKKHSVPVRLADVGRGLLYVVLTVTTVQFVVDRPAASSGGGGSKEQGWTARLLATEYGPWLVGLAGVAILVIGGYLLYRGATQRFAETLEISEMSAWERQWLPRLGTIGYVARGVVIAVVGWFVLQAAVQFEPRESVGIDGALRRLLDRSYGPPVVTALAVGLAGFGVYSFVEARYRKVLDD